VNSIVSSSTGLTADGKMSLAFALPSLIVGVLGVWIACTTYMWMNKQHEVMRQQAERSINVQINMQLLAVST